VLENMEVDVLVVTETETPDTAAPFATTGYVTFFPLVREKERTRMLVLAKATLVTLAGARLRNDLMDLTACQTV
jgi:hypothetical protein